MLNELLVVERGARQAGVEMTHRHPDIKDVGKMPKLAVALGETGQISAIRPVSPDVTPWTFRHGQHNSFPFHKPKPLLRVVGSPDDDDMLKTAIAKRSNGRRNALLKLTKSLSFNEEAFVGWPTKKMLEHVKKWRNRIVPLRKPQAAIVLETFDRFLLACKSPESSKRLIQSIHTMLLAELEEVAQSDWLDIAAALLIGKYNKKKSKWECAGGLLFEADGFESSIIDTRLIEAISSAMAVEQTGNEKISPSTICALTGRHDELVSDKFPQPNIAILGQTFLFAKNTVIPANNRYGRFATDAMRVGQETVIKLSAAFRSLTTPGRQGLTWRSLPGEAPKQTDLLLAYVDVAFDAPVAGTFADDGDFTQDDSEDGQSVDSIAAFEKRTERVIDAVRGTVRADIRETPVRVAVFRKVDPANRKAVYSGTPTVAQLFDSATSWATGERNLPPWVLLPVLRKGERKPRTMNPPHVAPLGLIAFAKKRFLRNGQEDKGTKAKPYIGLPAAEAINLFLEQATRTGDAASRRAVRVLRLILNRRTGLVSGTAHALRKGFDFVKPYDRGEALRTMTVLGILLHKLNRTKEVYMTDSAFRLGQLLAALDVVHAGYCADVRKGAVPPSLLGNQVFTMAQKAPLKALAMICRRWKPYDGWAKKVARDRERIDELKNSKKKGVQQRGWDILKATRHAREIQGIAEELAKSLRDCTPDDLYRAELLLGYIAGLAATERDSKEEDRSE